MGLRHLGRELALKALYQIDIRGGGSREELALLFDGFGADERARKFAVELVEGVERERAVLDRHLADALEHWSIGRLSRVDHNILRVALYELLWMAGIPARVTIDEAIELAKAYGDQDSGRFVNGVLDELAGRLGLRQKGEQGEARSVGEARNVGGQHSIREERSVGEERNVAGERSVGEERSAGEERSLGQKRSLGEERSVAKGS